MCIILISLFFFFAVFTDDVDAQLMQRATTLYVAT